MNFFQASLNFNTCPVVSYSVWNSNGHTVGNLIILRHTELFFSLQKLAFTWHICVAWYLKNLLLYHYHFFICSFLPHLPFCNVLHFVLLVIASFIPSIIFDKMVGWAFLDCVVYWQLPGIICEATLIPPERYQIIQNSPWSSILPFKRILKMFAGNLLKIAIKIIFPDLQVIDILNI